MSVPRTSLVDLGILFLLLISLVSGVILLLTGSLGLVIAQAGLPSDSVVPEPIPNDTAVPPSPSSPDSQSNTLQSLPDIPFK